MKSLLTPLVFVSTTIFFSTSAFAVTRYVNLASNNSTPPFTNWNTAATTIQAAINEANPGDLILVADGNYVSGNTNVNGANRIAINKAVAVQSVNGPDLTRITGQFQNPAIRCAYVGSGAVLSGFTLTGGRGVVDGGGVYCDGGTLSNCVVTGNTALRGGGGVAGGTLYNCTINGNNVPGFGSANGMGGGLFGSVAYNCRISGNTAGWSGGGVRDSVLYNSLVDGNACFSTNLFLFGGGAAFSALISCTVVGNHTGTLSGNGGGTYGCTVSNSIVYYNSPENDTGSSINFSCISPQADGTGNFSNEPIYGNDYQLLSNSPCINSGDNSMVVGAADQAGNPRIIGGFVDVGALEFQAASFPSAYVTVNYSNLVVGFAASFNGGYNWGWATTATWDFGDGTVVSNTLTPTHAWAAPGDYLVIAQIYAPNNAPGLSATVGVHVATQIVYYVDSAGTNPIPPYLSWQTAATNIQDAIGVATPTSASLVLVTDGIYQFGGQVIYGSLTNRLAITKPIAIQSVNGPKVTIIQGYQVTNSIYGDSAVRCVYLTNNASLTGFTITGGSTRMSGDAQKEQSGGGIWCESTNSVLVNCNLTGNFARWAGGGVFRGSLINCKLERNRAEYNSGGGAAQALMSHCTLLENSCGLNGGGVDQSILDVCVLSRNLATISGGSANNSVLKHCTVTCNSAGTSGGGVVDSALTDSVVYYNWAQQNPNYTNSVFSYCCTVPSPPGFGNISSEPQLTDGIHVASNSPCLAAGYSGSEVASDLDGESWLNPPAIGCDEYFPSPMVGPLDVAIRSAYTNVAASLTQQFVGVITGQASYCVWDFGGEQFTNQPAVVHSFPTEGNYVVRLTAYNASNPAGVTATAVVQVVSQPVHYVSVDNPNPVTPYFSWETAATNIQDAVDVAYGGGIVLVTNGVYQAGGRVYSSGVLTNRLIVDKEVIVRSASGSQSTTIRGSSTNGDSAIRCVTLSHGARLIGFTLADGATRNSGDVLRDQSGGGIWCESPNEIVRDCIIKSNSAAQFGGGAYSGSLSNCILAGNTAFMGGGAWGGMLDFCTVGTNSANNAGGVASNTLNNCVVFGNKGGGANGCVLNNCLVAGNTNVNLGGGAMNSLLNNCLVQSNSARAGGGIYGGVATNCVIVGNLAGSSGGGGTFQAVVNNSLISANRAAAGPGGGGSSSTFNNCLVSSNSSTTSASGVYSCFLNNSVVVGHTNGFAVSAGAHKNSIVYNNAANYTGAIFSNCCTVPLPPGYGNFTNNPSFVDLMAGDFHLQSNSPCINAGDNRYVTNVFDLDGHNRIQGGTVDIGAYEFQSPGSSLSYAWAFQFGLPTDGSADFGDVDGDGMSNYSEWRADTNPTNSLSALLMLYATNSPTGIRVAWQSVSSRSYRLERTTELASPAFFQAIATNIPGASGTKIFIDTSATNASSYFYRVRVN